MATKDFHINNQKGDGIPCRRRSFAKSCRERAKLAIASFIIHYPDEMASPRKMELFGQIASKTWNDLRLEGSDQLPGEVTADVRKRY